MPPTQSPVGEDLAPVGEDLGASTVRTVTLRLMPLLGLILGGISFLDLKIVISAATEQTAEVAIMYGNFIQKVIDFLIVAFVLFLMVRTINSFRDRLEEKKKEEVAAPPAAPVIPADIALLTEIRDLLKK